MKRLLLTLLGLVFFVTPSFAADVIILPMGGAVSGGTTAAPLEVLMLATDPIGIEVDGTTNDYTGSDAGVTALLQRDINRTGDINNYAGWQSYLNLKHPAATIAGDFFAYGNITRMFNDGATITNPAGTDRQYWEVGAHNTVKEEGNYDTAGAGVFNTRFIGTYSWVWADTYDVFATGGAVANVFEASGLDIKVEHVPTLNGAATGTFNSYGIYIDEVTGSLDGTSTAYGIYIADAVSGADTNYAFYSASTEASYFAGLTQFGTAAGAGQVNITPASVIDGLYINQNNGAADAIEINADDDGYVLNSTAKYGIRVNTDVTGGYGLEITTNLDAAGTYPLVKFKQAHASTTQPTLFIDHDGTAGATGYGLHIDSENAVGPAARIESASIALSTSGGRITNITTVNAATYDLLTTDYILNVTYTATGAVTSLTLPTAQTVSGRIIYIKDAGGSATTNNITIDTEGAQTIDGAATLVITTNYSAVTLYCDGTDWFIM